MKISAEISYYPLHDEFVDPIRDFIHRLNGHSRLICRTNGMSTQVFGEYEDVMGALQSEIKKSFDLPKSVFIIKLVNSDLNVKE